MMIKRNGVAADADQKRTLGLGRNLNEKNEMVTTVTIPTMMMTKMMIILIRNDKVTRDQSDTDDDDDNNMFEYVIPYVTMYMYKMS